MSGLATLLSRPRLVFTTAALLAAMGMVAWHGMDRQEDPRLPDYWGQVTASLPGADPETVERLLLEPIEDELATVPEVKILESTAFPELVVVEVELSESTEDIDEAWDEVREALARAAVEFPVEAGAPRLSEDQQDQESVVIAVTGSPYPSELSRAADVLEDRLLRLSLVERVTRIADPEEQVTVALDDHEALRLGLSAPEVARQLAGRSALVPGGSIRVGPRRVSLMPQSDLRGVDDLRSTPLLLPNGGTVPLASVAEVRLGPIEPRAALMRHDGVPAVGVGVVPRPGINVVRFGEEVRGVVDATGEEIAPLELSVIAFQPERVAQRLDDLRRSLLFGVAIVAGTLFLAMGLRVGMVVASVVPLVVLTALAVYAFGGGVLHQISVAAVVIALGMLVDNAIVVTESVQWRLDRGEEPQTAARRSVRELLVPLAAATATTLAVFVPMLLAKGATAEFTRAIPVVIVITLTASYLFAVWFTPALAALVLRPRPERRRGRFQAVADRLAELPIRSPGLVTLAALALVTASFLAAGLVRQEFFPESDRNQLLVEIELPEGTHLVATDRLAQRVEAELLGRPEVTAVSAFVGRSAPHFYYNLSQIPWSSHVAQLVVETTSVDAVEGVQVWLRSWSRAELPEAELVARKLEQGPPVLAPVELRLYGDDLETLRLAAERTMRLLRDFPGTADVRHTLGAGSPVLRFAVDDAAAARQGVDRERIAWAIWGRSRGTPIGTLRTGDDPVPIVLRSRDGEELGLAPLPALDVAAAGGHPVPLAEVASERVEWQPGAIDHRQRRRVVRVLAQLAPGASFSDVEARLLPRLDSLDLPVGVELERGGASEGSSEANEAMLRSVPLGAVLLVGILMAEFNSFRKVGLVLLTVPLAAAGVVPGLLLGDQPFGFMSLLGIIALVGVVVNNAIVLLDVVDAELAASGDHEAAVRAAIARRTRPILLTTATTVAGLLPLALSPTTLWPPLAWAMISGLTASTLLTLLVVPAAYLLLYTRLPGRPVRAAAIVAVALLLFGGVSRAAESEPETLTLDQAMDLAAARPRAEAAGLRAVAAESEARALARSTLWPSLEATGQVAKQDRDLLLSTPVGEFAFGSARQEAASLTLAQPLLDPARLYRLPAARQSARAAGHAERWTRQQAMALAADRYLDVVALRASIEAQSRYVASLEARAREARDREELGRSLVADRLRIELALARARQEALRLDLALETARGRLGTAVGRSGPVDPEPLAGLEASRLPPVEVMEGRGIAGRPDLDAMAAAVEAGRLETRAVGAEALPRLDGMAAYRWDSATPFADETWVEGALVVSWRPFAAGTRAPRRRAAERETEALAAELSEARREAEDEVRAARAAFETAVAAEVVATRGVEQATETARVEGERFRAGRATASDLLEAESEVRRQETERALAAVDRWRARVALALATGDLGRTAVDPAPAPPPTRSSNPDGGGGPATR